MGHRSSLTWHSLRVPAVYLRLAFWAFSASWAQRRMSKLRVLKGVLWCESHPRLQGLAVRIHSEAAQIPRTINTVANRLILRFMR